MTTHTPLPWKAHGCAVYQADDWREGKNLGGQKIVGLEDDAYPTNQNIANAELIVRAVNSHQALCDALKAVVAALTQPVQTSGLREPTTCDILRGDATFAVNTARQALNQAKL